MTDMSINLIAVITSQDTRILHHHVVRLGNKQTVPSEYIVFTCQLSHNQTGRNTQLLSKGCLNRRQKTEHRTMTYDYSLTGS